MTDQFWESLSPASSGQKSQHHLRHAQNCLGVSGGYSVVTAQSHLRERRDGRERRVENECEYDMLWSDIKDQG